VAETDIGLRHEQQFADPTVSQRKFDREVADYQSLEPDYRRRGWFMVDATFPKVHVVLASPKLTPPAIITGVLLDYTNYDARPPSVRLVNPFTAEPYRARDLPTQLNQAARQQPPVAGLPPGVQFVAAQPLMQFYSPDDIPFLCLAGVREYHDHPGHSGDTWELRRSSGAGALVRLLDIIYRYGVEPIGGYQVNLVPQVTFAFGEPPA
jgi:hypothetical protein